MNREAVGRKQW